MSGGQVQQLLEMIARWRRDLTPMPEQLRLTQQQWDQVRSEIPEARMPDVAPEVTMLGTPVVIVEREEDSTIHQERCIRAFQERWRS